VQPLEEDTPPIALYETGVVFVPYGSGKYGVNERKLATALAERERDMRALFVQSDGILPQVCEMLTGFLQMDDQAEAIHAAALRFLNECRRLSAMWV